MTDKESTEQRLQRALSQLIDDQASNSTSSALTVTALCQLGGVSRTTLYRYHPSVLHALHEWNRQRCSKAADSQQVLEELREERAALRSQTRQLAALVDHYFAAWSESQSMLKRRESELAALRRSGRMKLRSLRHDDVSPATGRF